VCNQIVYTPANGYEFFKVCVRELYFSRQLT